MHLVTAEAGPLTNRTLMDIYWVATVAWHVLSCAGSRGNTLDNEWLAETSVYLHQPTVTVSEITLYRCVIADYVIV